MNWQRLSFSVSQRGSGAGADGKGTSVLPGQAGLTCLPGQRGPALVSCNLVQRSILGKFPCKCL